MMEIFLGKRVYLDANVFIYALEGFADYEAVCRELLAALDAGAFAGVTSELTVAEVLVHPLMHGATEIADAYRTVLYESPHLKLAPIDRNILEASAALRAGLRMRLPDAIHVATAAASACSVLLTGDKAMRAPAGLALVTLAELIAGNGKP